MKTSPTCHALLAGVLINQFAPSAALAQQVEVSAPASAETRLSLAKQIVDTAFPAAGREKMFLGTAEAMASQVQQAMVSTLPQDDEEAVTIINNWSSKFLADSLPILRRHIPALIGSFVAGYANQFSEQELRDILAFVRTSSGQAFFSRADKIMTDPAVAAANQAYMQEVMSRLPDAQKELFAQLQAHSNNKR